MGTESRYQKEIDDIIFMLENKDARGLDRVMYRYKEMGMGMILIAMYHGLKKANCSGNGDRGESGGEKE